MRDPDSLGNSTASASRDAGGEPIVACTGRDNAQPPAYSPVTPTRKTAARAIGIRRFVATAMLQNGLTIDRTVAGAPLVRSPAFTPRNAFSAAAPSAAAFVTAVTSAWYAPAFAAVSFNSMRPSDAIELTEFPPVRFVIW